MQGYNEPIYDLFTERVRDLTPVAVKASAVIVYTPFSPDSDFSRFCANVLSETELSRADKFITEFDASHFVQRRAFRRYCGRLALGAVLPLSQIRFVETDTGRPYLQEAQDLWFSFSSCRLGFLGAWSSRYAVGVDIEDKKSKLEPVEFAHQFFAESETKIIDGVDGSKRLDTFLKLWCLKEAALKSIGEGLPFGLDAFEFELAPQLRVVRVPDGYGDPGRFRSYLWENVETCTAFVTRDLAQSAFNKFLIKKYAFLSQMTGVSPLSAT